MILLTALCVNNPARGKVSDDRGIDDRGRSIVVEAGGFTPPKARYQGSPAELVKSPLPKMRPGQLWFAEITSADPVADSGDFGQSFRAEVGHLFRLMPAGHSD
jgi:hypothetical protein